MAGRGPAPQEHRQRPRDEKAGGPWDVLPAEGFTGRYPYLPKTWRREATRWERDPETREKFAVVFVEEVEYLEETRDWYRTFARSPMATKFITTDWRRLRDLAQLKDQFYRGVYQLAAEIRMQETRLGATIRDRQEMRVRVADPKPVAKAKDKPEPDAPAASVSNIADRRARMQNQTAEPTG